VPLGNIKKDAIPGSTLLYNEFIVRTHIRAAHAHDAHIGAREYSGGRRRAGSTVAHLFLLSLLSLSPPVCLPLPLRPQVYNTAQIKMKYLVKVKFNYK